MELKERSLDPHELGLKVGFEIHQQLATSTKLFCSCRCEDVEHYDGEFVRRLRPTQSELGEYDPAALFEFRKGRLIKYLQAESASCLVEADEEPPHDVNSDALDTALILSLTLKANIVDEVHIMRKIVIDGSNTTGFQRTMLIATNGILEVDSKEIRVQSISLEEDAAKLLSDDGRVRRYGLDRLGTPLIEVALAPITGSPDEIMQVALSLGRLMRATRRVARGLGSIRQDVNVSIKDGGIIEVKGVQKLDQLVNVIRYEMTRQHGLQLISEKIKEKKIEPSVIVDRIFDVSSLFSDTKSKVIKNAVEKGGIVNAVRLRGFAGLLSYEPYDQIRLGKELGELVRFYGLGGVFHSDELPSYGIDDDDIASIRKKLSCDPDDAFVILAGPEENVKFSVEGIIERLRQAVSGVPAETRAPTQEGMTIYSRPRPGAARMYPETDIPPIGITKQRLDSLKTMTPKDWHTIIGELSAKYDINHVLAEKVFDSDYMELFEEIASKGRIQPSFVAATLTETLVSLEREGLDTDRISRKIIKNCFEKLEEGSIAKESAVLIFQKIAKGEARSVDEAIDKLGLKSISDAELNTILDKIIGENIALIREKGRDAMGMLMGNAMKMLRGKVDGQKVNTVLNKKLKEVLDN